MAEWTLYYDGGCNLCHASKLRAETWAEKAKKPLRVEILQSDESIHKGYLEKGLMVLEVGNDVLYGADAWLEIMKVSPWYLRPVSWMALTGPTRAVARFFYGWVARVRFKLFGVRACPIPSMLEHGTEETSG